MGVKELEVADTETSFWYIFFFYKRENKNVRYSWKMLWGQRESFFFFSVVIVDHACL